MGRAVSRAKARRLGLEGAGAEAGAPRPAGERREAWREDPAGLPAAVVPPHGPAISATEATPNRIESAPRGAGPGTWDLALYGADSPEVRGRRRLVSGADGAVVFERVEEQRMLRYRFEGRANRLTARVLEREHEAGAPGAGSVGLPPGLVVMRLRPADALTLDRGVIPLRLEATIDGSPRSMDADIPRGVMQRLVLGPEIDRTPGQPLPGLAPLPEAVGQVRGVMLAVDPPRWRAPWDGGPPFLAGEEDPLAVGRALGAWWRVAGSLPSAAVIGVDPLRSPRRWDAAPRPRDDALLLLPAQGFEGPLLSGWRTTLAAAWNAPRVVDELPRDPGTRLIVLVSAEPPGEFALRLRRLARDERLRGRLLAAWSLAGPVRDDLPAALLGEGRLAGIGLAESTLVARRTAADSVRALGEALSRRADEPRVEQLPGPFLWYF
jgi:hypothetical protein